MLSGVEGAQLGHEAPPYGGAPRPACRQAAGGASSVGRQRKWGCPLSTVVGRRQPSGKLQLHPMLSRCFMLGTGWSVEAGCAAVACATCSSTVNAL